MKKHNNYLYFLLASVSTFSSLSVNAQTIIPNNGNIYSYTMTGGSTFDLNGNAIISGSSVSKSIGDTLTFNGQPGGSTITMNNSGSNYTYLSLSGNTTVIANDIIFSGGRNNNYAGGVFSANYSNLTIDGTNVTIKDSYSRNNGGSSGGAIHLANGNLTILADTLTLENNRGDSSGGAVWISGDMSVAGNLNLINNEGGAAYSYGGAIRVENMFEATGTDKTINMSGNKAYHGGGAINATNYIKIAGTVNASGNIATTEHGGALRAIATANVSSVILSNSNTIHSFTDNKAGSSGGAIAGRYNVTISGSAVLSNNTAAVFGGAVFNGYGSNQSESGSSIIIGNSTATIVFSDNKAGYSIAGVANTSGAGGAAYTAGSITLKGQDIRIQNNIATNRGGAFFAQSGFNLQGTFSVTGNKALSTSSGNGGFLYNQGGFNLTATGDSTISGNMAGGKGGSIYSGAVNGVTSSIYADNGDIVFTGNRQNVTNFNDPMSGHANAVYIDAVNYTLNLTAETNRTIIFYDPISGNAANTVTININNGTDGTVLFSGENFIAGSADVQSLIAADTTVMGGVLALKDNVEYGISGTGSFTLDNGASFHSLADISGTNNIVRAQNITLDGETHFLGSQLQTLTLDGDVSLSNSVFVSNGAAGNILQITGDYTGNNGTIQINTQLGTDSSPTDFVEIQGNTSGSTILKVLNAGGGGAQTIGDGIQVIGVSGNSSSSAFVLNGDYITSSGQQAVIGGAYAYTLWHNGTVNPTDGNWYLRSQMTNPGNSGNSDGGTVPLYQPLVPVAEAYPRTLLKFMETETLRQRQGERFDCLPGEISCRNSVIWARIDGGYQHLEVRKSLTSPKISSDQWSLRSGFDAMFYETDEHKLIAGINVRYGEINSRIRSIYGTGTIDAEGAGIGGTLTWYGRYGLYLDAQINTMWFNSDLASKDIGSLTKGNNAFGYSASLEGGMKISLSENWSVTPQMQLSYGNVGFSRFSQEYYGGNVRHEDGDQFTGRIGSSLDYQTIWHNFDGSLSKANIYGIANLYYNFDDKTQVYISDIGFANKNESLWGGIGMGGSYEWDDGKYSVYGEAQVNSALRNSSDNYSIMGKLGFTMQW